MNKRRSFKLVDLDVDEYKMETDYAWLVVINDKEVWCSKSQCEFDEDDAVMTMPEWMAIEKELI